MRAKMTNELRERITIENFDVAVSQAPNCEHLRTKAWGDAYGKGVRCAKCGMELTSTHEDEEQQQGIGSGDDKRLMRRFDQHRRNEASFRFIRSAELGEVEAERVRLEKERRLINEMDPYFYDLHDMQALYQFDRRHKIELQASGAMRQGVQWDGNELANRLVRMQQDHDATTDPTKAAEKALAIKDWKASIAPPVERAVDLCHKGNFMELVYQMGRVNAYRSRLYEIARLRQELKESAAADTDHLDYVHHEVFRIEENLVLVEADLDATGVVLEIRKKAQFQYEESQDLLELAKVRVRVRVRVRDESCRTRCPSPRPTLSPAPRTNIPTVTGP